jgi:hypothetical protein
MTSTKYIGLDVHKDFSGYVCGTLVDSMWEPKKSRPGMGRELIEPVGPPRLGLHTCHSVG